MKKVILYGELAKRFGKYHTFSAKNAAEVIRALRANFKEFESFMCSAHKGNLGFSVYVGRESLASENEVHNPTGEQDVIRIVPVIMGSSKSPWVKILIGAALVAASFVIPVAPLVFAALGASMIIGGIAQLLTTPPNMPGQPGVPNNKTSFIFSGPTNTSSQGEPVPIGYGRMIVGSKVISAGIQTHEV